LDGRNVQVKLFTISASDNGELQRELNSFLTSHRILEIEQKFCENEKGGWWSFCIRYVGENERVKFPVSQQGFTKKDKPDYKDVLSQQEYDLFLLLKAARKEISVGDGVLPYNVFTDAELVEIIRLEDKSEKNISAINGIGEKRAQKYWKKVAEKSKEIDVKRKEEEKAKFQESVKEDQTK